MFWLWVGWSTGGTVVGPVALLLQLLLLLQCCDHCCLCDHCCCYCGRCCCLTAYTTPTTTLTTYYCILPANILQQIFSPTAPPIVLSTVQLHQGLDAFGRSGPPCFQRAATKFVQLFIKLGWEVGNHSYNAYPLSEY